MSVAHCEEGQDYPRLMARLRVHTTLRDASVFTLRKPTTEPASAPVDSGTQERLLAAVVEIDSWLSVCAGCETCSCIETNGAKCFSDLLCFVCSFAPPLPSSPSPSSSSSSSSLYPASLQYRAPASIGGVVSASGVLPWTSEAIQRVATSCMQNLLLMLTRSSSSVLEWVVLPFTSQNQERKEPDFHANPGAACAVAWFVLSRDKGAFKDYDMTSRVFMMLFKLVDDSSMHNKRCGLVLLRALVQSLGPTQVRWADVPILKVLIGCMPFREDQDVVTALVPCCVDVFAMLWEPAFDAPLDVTSFSASFSAVQATSATAANRNARQELLLDLRKRMLEEWSFLAIGKERAEFPSCLVYSQQMGLRLLPCLGSSVVPLLHSVLPPILAFAQSGPGLVDMKTDSIEDAKALLELQEYRLDRPPRLAALPHLPTTPNLLFPLTWAGLLALCALIQMVGSGITYHRGPLLETLCSVYVRACEVSAPLNRTKTEQAPPDTHFSTYAQLCAVSLAVEAVDLLCRVGNDSSAMQAELQGLQGLSPETDLLCKAVAARRAER
jgi:hypothetical protein